MGRRAGSVATQDRQKVARALQPWQGDAMANTPSRTPLAGGFLLAISLVIGPVVGAIIGEPSMGFVGGLAVGLVLAIGIWLIDRTRR